MRRWSVVTLPLAAAIALGGCGSSGTDPVQTAVDTVQSIEESATGEDGQEQDQTPPTFSGLADGTTITVRAGAEFNLKEYLAENVAAADETDGSISYRIRCKNDAYDRTTGAFDTQEPVTADVKLIATDAAGNKARLSLTVEVAPIRVTTDDPNPLVYEGKYGTISVTSFIHQVEYGVPMYLVMFDVNNTSDVDLQVALKSERTTVNGQQSQATYEQIPTRAGVHGQAISIIYDRDIPVASGGYATIDTYVALRNPGTGEDYLLIPLVLEVDAVD